MTTFSPTGGLPRTVLRLHRTGLVVWTVFVTATLAALMWLNTVIADRARDLEARCRDVDVCVIPLGFDYGEPLSLVSTVVCYSFLAVAAFAGGALVGRELESGTAHLAWTQGVTPARWLAAKLGVPALAMIVSGTVLVLTFRWGWQANRDLATGDAWSHADTFVALGPATIAYGLCALAVGTLTGLLLRRSLAALSVSFVAMWVLHFYVEHYRHALWPTVSRIDSDDIALPDRAWSVSGWSDSAGRHVVYHPESHFWPLHLMETGIVLTAAALSTVAAFAVLRRRTV
jgi:hypothetical protein